MADRSYLNPDALNELKEFSGEPLVNKLLGLYFEHVPGMIKLLQTAFDNRDLRTVIRTAHTLKSSSSSLGAELLYDLVTEIEIVAESEDLDALDALIAKVDETSGRTLKLLEKFV